ncbi:MAG: LysE family transporter [Synoicihabitans sp.]
MDQRLWIEFLAIAVAHGLAVASPGPDFALILRQSLRHGRATAIRTAIGIGCGISVHVTYALLGLGLLIRNSPHAFLVLKIAGGCYLLWMAWNALTAKPREALPSMQADPHSRAEKGAFRQGFLTNVLNPKAALFFVMLYTVVVSPDTSRGVQAVYGIWMAFWTAGWFTLVATIFTRPALRRAYWRGGVWVDRALGLVFLGFALNLFLAKLG